ncbi:MAG: SMI1/KNR4 family protein [Promethearchaeota archaeon]
MEKLIEMMRQQHPEFSDEIEGCSDKEIAELEALIPNTKIPEEYRVFLKYMGKKSGKVIGLRRKWHSSELEDRDDFRMLISIDYHSVLKFYKMAHKRGWLGIFSLPEDYGEDPADFFLFGIDNLGNDNGPFFLDLRNPDLPVVEISGTIEFMQHSPSFRAFLFEIPYGRTLRTYEHSIKWL